MGSPADFGATRAAEANRVAKARALAAWMASTGRDAIDVATASPATLRKWAREAGVNPPRDGSPTWTVACQLHAEGDHPPARRVEGHAEAASAPPPDMPRGWPELAALGPITPTQPCAAAGADGHPCERPAIIVMQASTGPRVARCADHPPRGSEWGAGLNWTPRPCSAPRWCLCGRCPEKALGRPSSTVVDDRAIASGRRRSAPHTYRAARAAVDRQG